MAPQSSDSRHEFVDERSEILSDATDLDALLAALLDHESTPVPITTFRRPASEARREPTVVAPPRVDFAPVCNADPLIFPVGEDEETDAFAKFQADSGPTYFDAPGETATLAEFAAPVVSPAP